MTKYLEYITEDNYCSDIEPVRLLNSITKTIESIIDWMIESEGHPQLVKFNDAYYIVEMSTESPKRRSVCYDKQSRLERKKFPPETSALELCEEKGVSLVDEAMYHYIQSLKDLDNKTSSWLLTPKETRDLGGALFGDKRYDRTFVYHNGADSYYGARGFRTYIKL